VTKCINCLRINHMVPQVNCFCLQDRQKEVQFLRAHIEALSEGIGDKPAFNQGLSDIGLFGDAQFLTLFDIILFGI
jgi:hypothetical protein